jgi:hypothetical protein
LRYFFLRVAALLDAASSKADESSRLASTAAWLLRGISSVGGAFVNLLWQPQDPVVQSREHPPEPKAQKRQITSNGNAVGAENVPRRAASKAAEQRCTFLTAEEHEDLQIIHGFLDQLQASSVLIGNELQRQNGVIQETSERTAAVADQIRRNEKVSKSIL